MSLKKTLLLIILLFGISTAGVFFAKQILSHKQTQVPAEAPATNAPPEYQRIICLAPSITEIVFALGGQQQIVGVTEFCKFPEAAQDIQKVGAYINPNFEKIIALNPDLIIYQGHFEKMTQFCQDQKIEFLNFELDNIDNVFTAILKIGKKIGRLQESAEMCQKIKTELSKIESSHQGQIPKKVFISMFREKGSMASLATIGPNTFINELVEIAGGKNIFDDVKELYPKISKESLLKRTPEIIIEIHNSDNLTPEIQTSLAGNWQFFPDIPAVQNDKIYFTQESSLFIPGPRLAIAAKTLSVILRGDLDQ